MHFRKIEKEIFFYKVLNLITIYVFMKLKNLTININIFSTSHISLQEIKLILFILHKEIIV
jgi:hypothetical protein